MTSARFYWCPVCKNIVGLIHGDGSKLECCGKPMQEMKANVTDAAAEKHVPVVEKTEEGIRVSVGSTMHRRPRLPRAAGSRKAPRGGLSRREGADRSVCLLQPPRPLEGIKTRVKNRQGIRATGALLPVFLFPSRGNRPENGGRAVIR